MNPVYIKATDATGNNALHLACLDTTVARADRKIKLLLEIEPLLMTQCNSEGDYPLHIAAKQCSTVAIETMLDAMAAHSMCDVNILQKSSGATALHLAIAHNTDDVVSTLLLDKNIDVNIACKNGDTPLDIAIKLQLADVAAAIRKQKSCLAIANSNAVVEVNFKVRKM